MQTSEYCFSRDIRAPSPALSGEKDTPPPPITMLPSKAIDNNCSFCKNYYSSIYKFDLFNNGRSPLQRFAAAMEI